MKTTIDAMKRSLHFAEACSAGGYTDVDRDWVDTYYFDVKELAELIPLLKEAIAREEAQAAEPVGVVDEGDDGLFVDLETPNGVMVKRGDKLFARPALSPSGEREAFEVWMHRRYKPGYSQLQKDSDGDYRHKYTMMEWAGWRARADMLAADAQVFRTKTPYAPGLYLEENK